MSDFLTYGALNQIAGGRLPDTFNVQVLATKPLSDGKYRLKLNDGKDTFVHAVLDTGGTVQVPAKFSVIRISSEETPDHIKNPTIMSISKDNKDKFALIISHYQLLRPGEQVGAEIKNQDSNGNLPSHNQTTPDQNKSLNMQMRSPPVKTEESVSINGHLRQSVKRNLETEMQGPSPKKPNVGAPGPMPTHVVDSLTQWTNKHKIKVMIESKEKRRHIDRLNKDVQDCILTDESGSIKLTAWGHDDTAKLDKLIVGKTYLMENMKIQPVRDRRFNVTKHDFELIWLPSTAVTGPLTSCPVQLGYSFTRIHELHAAAADTEVSVLAWVRQAGEVLQFTARSSGRDLRKREVLLADSSGGGGASIALVLWAEDADTFSGQDKIIAIRKATVKEFNGVKNLNFSRGASYEEAPQCPELAELERWVEGVRAAVQEVAPAPGQAAPTSGPLTTIQEIKDAMAEDKAEKKFVIAAFPVKINSDSMWYRAHQPRDGKTCRKKVMEDEQRSGTFNCRCGDRNLSVTETELRFMVNMNLMDTTSNVWAVMFEAGSLFGLSAQELQDMKDRNETEFSATIARVCFTLMTFSVTAKIETFNGSPKLKFAVHSAESVWGEVESSERFMKRRWAEVVALERELGVTHKEDLGLAVTGKAAYSNFS